MKLLVQFCSFSRSLICLLYFVLNSFSVLLAASTKLSGPFIVESSEPLLLSLSPAKPASPLEKKVFWFSSYKPQWHSLEKLSFCDNCLWSKVAFQLTLYYDYLLYFAKHTLGESTKDLLWAFPVHHSILVYKFLSYLKPRKAFHLQPVLLQRFTNF